VVSTPGEGQAKSSKVAALGADPEHAYERSDCDPPSQALDGLLLPAGLINVGVSALNVVQGVGLDRSQGGTNLSFEVADAAQRHRDGVDVDERAGGPLADSTDAAGYAVVAGSFGPNPPAVTGTWAAVVAAWQWGQ